MKRLGQISTIQLQGKPYQQTAPAKVDCNLALDALARSTKYTEELASKIEQAREHLRPLTADGFNGLEKLASGQNLSFAEAFSVAVFVCSALNIPLGQAINDSVRHLGAQKTHMLQAVAVLSMMSAKEAYIRLSPEEIAGFVAATVHLDTVVRIPYPEEILAFNGMGGDRGYLSAGHESKLFSVSTLSAVALAADRPTYKQHSYPNTSKISGQSAIEAYGARSDFHSQKALEAVLADADLLMVSCHNIRTLHTLSHVLKWRTINHLIGPLAYALASSTPIQAFIGVNESVHPETIIQTLQILDKTGYQKYANSAVYCGTNLRSIPKNMLDPQTYHASARAKESVRLDEVAPPPYASLVAFLAGGSSMGAFGVYPEDFYSHADLKKIDFKQLLVPNTAKAILRSNTEALSGQDEAKSRYLAMTMGLGIFTREYLDRPDALDSESRRLNSNYLRQATLKALELILSGQASRELEKYVGVTQKYAG